MHDEIIRAISTEGFVAPSDQCLDANACGGADIEDGLVYDAELAAKKASSCGPQELCPQDEMGPPAREAEWYTPDPATSVAMRRLMNMTKMCSNEIERSGQYDHLAEADSSHRALGAVALSTQRTGANELRKPIKPYGSVQRDRRLG